MLRVFLVTGVVLPGLRPGECHFGDALLSETRIRSARVGLFLTLGLHEQAPDARAIKNPLRSRNGFLLVDPAVPISNHFYKNLTEIYDLKDMLWNEGIISYDDLCLTITGDKGKKGLPHRS